MKLQMFLWAVSSLFSLVYAACDWAACASKYCPSNVGDVEYCLCYANDFNNFNLTKACLGTECSDEIKRDAQIVSMGYCCSMISPLIIMP